MLTENDLPSGNKEIKNTLARNTEDDKSNTLLANKPSDERPSTLSSLKFNPASGFTMPAEMLAQLNLPKVTDSVLKFNPASGFTMPAEMVEQLNLPSNTIDITITNEYTLEEKTSLIKSFYILEEGIFLGIIIGITSKAEVIKIMEENSSNKFDISIVGSALFYDDIAVNFYFDQSDIVSELDFGKGFRGATSKGLRMGDPLEKAIEIYGPPRMKTSIGAIWDNMKIFSEDFLITGIKIRK